MKTKRCYKCQKNKSFDDFANNKTRSDGKQSICKLCKQEMDKVYYQVNKDKYINYNRKRREEIKQLIQKKKMSCKCGEQHIAALDFHHIDPTKKEINVSQLLSHKWCDERIEQEIAKCIVICSNCHRKLHWGQSFAGEAPGSYPGEPGSIPGGLTK